MATPFDRYVNRASTPGGDGTTNATTGDHRAYATWSEAEGGEQAAYDGTRLVCHIEGTSIDTTAVTINGNTFVDADDYMTWIVDSDKRHQGVKSSSYYQLAVSNAHCLTIYDDHVRVYGVQFVKTSSSAHSQACINITAIAAGGYLDVGYCLCEQAGNASYTEPGIVINDADLTFRIYNCVVYGMGAYASSSSSGIYIWNCSSGELYYNTVDGGYRCYRFETGTLTVNNNRGENSGVANSVWSNNGASDSGSSSHNGSDDTSSFGSDALTSQTWSYDSGYLLASDDPGIGNGTPVSITDDILGNVRDGSAPDIGFHEYTSGGGEEINVTCTDGIDISDSPASQTELQAGTADGIDVSDSVTAQAELQAVCTDGLSISDVISAMSELQAVCSDGLSISDSITGTAVFAAVATDGLSISDSSTAQMELNVTCVEGVSLSDVVSSVAELIGIATDGITILESLSEGSAVYGDLVVTISVRNSKVTISARETEVDTSIRQTKINMEVQE